MLTCFSGPQGVGKQSGGASKARGRPIPQPAVGPTLVPRPASSLSLHRDLSFRAQLWTPAPTWGPIPHGAQLQIPAHQEMFESWVQGSALGWLCKLLSSSTCSPMMAGAPCYGLLHPRACVSVVSMWMSRHVGGCEDPIPSGAGVWYVKLACEQQLRRGGHVCPTLGGTLAHALVSAWNPPGSASLVALGTLQAGSVVGESRSGGLSREGPPPIEQAPPPDHSHRLTPGPQT